MAVELLWPVFIAKRSAVNEGIYNLDNQFNEHKLITIQENGW